MNNKLFKSKLLVLAIAIVELLILSVSFFKLNSISYPEYVFSVLDMTEETDGQTTIWSSEDLEFPMGIYNVNILYSQGNIADGGAWSVAQYSDGSGELSDKTPLFFYVKESNYSFYAYNSTNVVNVLCGTDDNTVSTEIGLITVTVEKYRTLAFFMIRTLAILLLIDAVMITVYYLVDVGRDNRQTCISLIAVMALSALPLFLLDMGHGDDIQIHLLRIAGLADEIRNFQIPVRMQSMLLNGYGYPISVFYPDMFYIFPAVLYMLGVPLYMAYKSYIVAMTIVAVLIAWYSFKKMSSGNDVGIWGALIYVCSLWRFIDVYNRAAVGEYTALCFLPLIMLAMYKFTKEESDKKKATIALIIGYSGMLQSHLLTTVILSIFLCFFVLIFWKEFFVKRNILYVVSAAFATLLLNLWFIVPLVDYYLSYDLVVKTSVNELWTSAISFGQLFSMDMLSYDDNGVSVGLIRSPGIALLIIALITVVAIAIKSIKQDKKWIIALLIFSLLSTYMVLDSFPYEYISEHLVFIYKIIGSVQYPMRYNIFATLFFALLGVMIVTQLKEWNKSVANIVMLVIGVISITSWGVLTYQYVENVDSEAVISGAYYGTFTWDRQYLLSDTDREQTKNFDIYTSDSLQVTENSREDGVYNYYIYNQSSEEGYADLDILMYKGYRAYTDAGEELELEFGANNRVRVDIPAGFDGSITVSYHEPIYWRVSELVSILALIGFVVIAVKFFSDRKLK